MPGNHRRRSNALDKRRNPILAGSDHLSGGTRWPSLRPLVVQWAKQRAARRKSRWVRKTRPRLSKAELDALPPAWERAADYVAGRLKYPVEFSPEAVDRIVDAVASALKRGPIPANLDRQQLGRDLDRALFWYETKQ